MALAYADQERRGKSRLQVDDVLARERDDRLDAGLGEGLAQVARSRPSSPRGVRPTRAPASLSCRGSERWRRPA